MILIGPIPSHSRGIIPMLIPTHSQSNTSIVFLFFRHLYYHSPITVPIAMVLTILRIIESPEMSRIQNNNYKFTPSVIMMFHFFVINQSKLSVNSVHCSSVTDCHYVRLWHIQHVIPNSHVPLVVPKLLLFPWKSHFHGNFEFLCTALRKNWNTTDINWCKLTEICVKVNPRSDNISVTLDAAQQTL